jgi:hypothetical protein
MPSIAEVFIPHHDMPLGRWIMPSGRPLSNITSGRRMLAGSYYTVLCLH